MTASLSGYTEVVELLLIQDSSLDFVRHKNGSGMTALMAAAKGGHEDVVKLLLQYDPSEEHIMMEDDYGRTAIDWAKTKKIRGLLSTPPIASTKRAKPSVD